MQVSQGFKNILLPILLFFRKAFKVSMKPYDVRDVVEAFGAGQARDTKQCYTKQSFKLYLKGGRILSEIVHNL